jgi:23S rRNA (cytosine1962-C5)-methyltransferase
MNESSKDRRFDQNGSLKKATGDVHMGTIVLKKNRESSLLRRHPWIFSGAIKEKDVSENGETVEIQSAEGEFLARGAYSASSQIAVRIWTFDPGEEITAEFFHQRLSRAIRQRIHLIKKERPTACRLVYAESDGLPGLIVDQYDQYLVCQFLSAGAEYWKKDIARLLQELSTPAGIYERSDADVRLKEGLPPRQGILSGQPPPPLVCIYENDIRFAVDIPNGHKTGFYLDQRDNREILSHHTLDRDVLNCFSYTGGFAVYALKGGARSVMNVDSSNIILELAEHNMQLNNLSPERYQNVSADVFHLLRTFRDSRRSFDVIILDPPKFAESERQVDKASRGYKDINLLAFKLLRPGGLLFTFSCSGHISAELFQKIIADAALDAGRDARIIQYLGQSADHPIALPFPESRYLKGLICEVI